MSRTHSEGLEPGAWKIIAVAILGPFMSQMDSTVVNVSLSFIKQELTGRGDHSPQADFWLPIGSR
jgi:hypothetical protein